MRYVKAHLETLHLASEIKIFLLFFALFFLMFGMSLALASGLKTTVPSGKSPSSLCLKYISQNEANYEIPANLLRAVGMAESGRWQKYAKDIHPWPWTVMAEGQGRFFNTKMAAVAHVKALKRRGVRNIDVGCMQVNLMYHGQEFPSVEMAMEPRSNVRYAAQYLSTLKDVKQSWVMAVGRYHSSTPKRATEYRLRVFDNWNKVTEAALDNAPSHTPQKLAQKLAQNLTAVRR